MSCRNKIFVRKQLGPQALLWKSLSVVNTLHKYSLNCPRMSFVQNSLHSASQPWQMWDQHVETSPSPGLHQTFICNSLHNGIVVKPTQNSDSILIRSYVPSGQFSVLFTGLWWIKHCVYVTRHTRQPFVTFVTHKPSPVTQRRRLPVSGPAPTSSDLHLQFT